MLGVGRKSPELVGEIKMEVLENFQFLLIIIIIKLILLKIRVRTVKFEIYE
jgi:hypothetical protein